MILKQTQNQKCVGDRKMVLENLHGIVRDHGLLDQLVQDKTAVEVETRCPEEQPL